MGIFDNVNWQQALPGALMGVAGAMDPRSGPMLAESGWNAVKSYMEQQRLQQQQEQFEGRMKQIDKELSMRERYLKQSEAEFADKQDRRNDTDFVFNNLDAFSDMSGEEGFSEYVNRINARAKEAGRKPISAGTVAEIEKSWKFMPTETGEIGFGLNENGDLWAMEQVQGAGGKKTWRSAKVAGRITPQMAKALEDSPEMAKQFATSLRKQDEKKYKGIADAIEFNADRKLKERDATQASKDYAERLKSIENKRKLLDDAWKTQWGYDENMKDIVSPHQPGSKEDNEWKAGARKAKEGITRQLMSEYEAIDADMRKNNPKYDREVKKQEGTDTAKFEQRLSDEEKRDYIWGLKDMARMGVPQKAAEARVKALIELKRKMGIGMHGTPNKSQGGAVAAPAAPVPSAREQREAWRVNPAQPMPTPLIPSGPMARPLDYEEQRRREELRRMMAPQMGGYY